MAREYQYLLAEREGPTFTITMNRPERRNSLCLELLEELTRAFDEAGASDATGVILAGNGKVFSTGHDFADMIGQDLQSVRLLFATCTNLMNTMQAIPQPVVARVHALATGAGCQLVATADLAVASQEATFCTPGGKGGLFCTTPMVALTRAIGRKRALQMLLTGEPVDARTAAEWGLINDVVPAASLAGATRKLAAKVAEASSLVVAIGKQAFYTQIEMDVEKAYAYAKEVMSLNAMAADAQEGIGAFLGKRAPCWSGK